MQQTDPAELLKLAFQQAQQGLVEGGVPIGAVLVKADGSVLGAGCNGHVQHGDPLLHAETAAIRAAEWMSDYSDTILVTTMTPCWYCAGLVRFLGIGMVVVGDNESWPEAALDWLASEGVSTTRLHDQACVEMFTDWLSTEPQVWSTLPSSVDGSKPAT